MLFWRGGPIYIEKLLEKHRNDQFSPTIYRQGLTYDSVEIYLWNSTVVLMFSFVKSFVFFQKTFFCFRLWALAVSVLHRSDFTFYFFDRIMHKRMLPQSWIMRVKYCYGIDKLKNYSLGKPLISDLSDNLQIDNLCRLLANIQSIIPPKFIRINQITP